MIGDVLAFIKDELNAAVPCTIEGIALTVGYPDFKQDPTQFYSPVSLLLINMQEETQSRPADRYVMMDAEGMKQPAQPPLRLFLHLLFAARPSAGGDYETSLGYLSGIMKFFQANPVFESTRFPKMVNKNLEDQKLMVEFHSLTYTQQNEIWGSLKSTFLPSVCYRVKMVIYQEEPASIEGEIEKTELILRQ